MLCPDSVHLAVHFQTEWVHVLEILRTERPRVQRSGTAGCIPPEIRELVFATEISFVSECRLSHVCLVVDSRQNEYLFCTLGVDEYRVTRAGHCTPETLRHWLVRCQ